MQPKKLTPLEILHRQKADLQIKANELAVEIENKAKYLQQNFVPLLSNTLIVSVVSKMPPQLQNIAGNFLQKENKAGRRNSSALRVAQGIVAGVSTVAPFFLKGKKGVIISMALKQILKLIRI
jgi:hypothetical protein